MNILLPKLPFVICVFHMLYRRFRAVIVQFRLAISYHIILYYDSHHAIACILYMCIMRFTEPNYLFIHTKKHVSVVSVLTYLNVYEYYFEHINIILSSLKM